MDASPFGLSGKEAEILLDKVGITVNKNLIPFDPRPPLDPSGIRFGTPAITTRGFVEDDMQLIGQLITRVLKHASDEVVLNEVRGEIKKLTKKYPLYLELI